MRIDVSNGQTLEHTIAYAITLIDRAAGEARARYITVAPGQDATYQLKAEEAQRYVDAGSPLPLDAESYPFLAAETQATGKSPNVAAGVILDTRDAWIAKAAQIEGVRLAGKKTVGAATTWSACVAAREATIDQLKAL